MTKDTGGLRAQRKVSFLQILPLLLAGACCSAQVQAADRSGKEVVDAVCIKCHGSGKDGAPKIGDQNAWSQHAAKGLNNITGNAITGVRKMPAHGGQAALSDLEISRAVAYMVSGGHAVDTDKPYATPQYASGAQIVKERCQDCHATGKIGAPKLGDLEAWKPRLKNGVDPLVKSAINGHNSMPARGGMANLSDADMKAAVNHIISLLGTSAKN